MEKEGIFGPIGQNLMKEPETHNNKKEKGKSKREICQLRGQKQRENHIYK